MATQLDDLLTQVLSLSQDDRERLIHLQPQFAGPKLPSTEVLTGRERAVRDVGRNSHRVHDGHAVAADHGSLRQLRHDTTRRIRLLIQPMPMRGQPLTRADAHAAIARFTSNEVMSLCRARPCPARPWARQPVTKPPWTMTTCRSRMRRVAGGRLWIALWPPVGQSAHFSSTSPDARVRGRRCGRGWRRRSRPVSLS